MSFDDLMQRLCEKRLLSNEKEINRLLKKVDWQVPVEVTNLSPEQVDLIKNKNTKVWRKLHKFYPLPQELEDNITKAVIKCLDKFFELTADEKLFAKDYINKRLVKKEISDENYTFAELSARIICYLNIPEQRQDLIKKLSKGDNQLAHKLSNEIDLLINNELIKQTYLTENCPDLEVTSKGADELVSYICREKGFEKELVVNFIKGCVRKTEVYEKKEIPQEIIECLKQANLITEINPKFSYEATDYIAENLGRLIT